MSGVAASSVRAMATKPANRHREEDERQDDESTQGGDLRRRISLYVDKQVAEDLEWIKEETGGSEADIVRVAILLRATVQRLLKQKEVLLVKSPDGQISELKLFMP
jgi:hypothetical protein